MTVVDVERFALETHAVGGDMFRHDAERHVMRGIGADLEARNALGNSPLLAAIEGRQAATARTLLKLGADPRLRNSASLSATDLAARVGDPGIAAALAGR